jgi:predicted Zn-dependent peptidase
MMMMSVLAAALSVALAAPATVDLGAAKLYTQADAGAQLVGMQLVVPAGTARQTPQQSGLAALTAETLLLEKIDGLSLTDRVANAGGSIDFAVEPSVVRFEVEATPAALPAIAADVARVIRMPAASVETVSAARAVLSSRIDDEEKNPVLVGLDMLRGSYYQGGAGTPALGTRASLAMLGPADVGAFLAAHYRRGAAFATATGVVDDATSAAVRTVIAALPDGAEPAPALDVRPLGPISKRLITRRDLVVPFVLVGYAAPSMSDRDFAAMLVLRALLGDIATRDSAATLSPFERGINVIYTYDVKPSTFVVAINGSQLDPGAGLTIVQAILKNAQSKPLAPDVLKRYRDAAYGQWALEAVTLTDRAWQIGAAVSEGADPDAGRSIAQAIAHVTGADVQRAAKNYLQRSTIALVLPRTGS